jgi:hypothetical protein
MTYDTTIFWEGSGATYGCNPSSFWANNYATAVALCFLDHYLLFWHIAIAQPEQVHYDYADNKSVPRWLLFGHLSLEWTHLQTQHIKSEKLNSCKYSGSTWAIKIHKYI